MVGRKGSSSRVQQISLSTSQSEAMVEDGFFKDWRRSSESVGDQSASRRYSASKGCWWWDTLRTKERLSQTSRMLG